MAISRREFIVGPAIGGRVLPPVAHVPDPSSTHPGKNSTATERSMWRRPSVMAAAVAGMMMALPSPRNALAQGDEKPESVQTTGTPGSPSATTTIPGNQLPPAAPKFGGVIKENIAQSKSWWPPRVVPPKGAPNILLIMTDDVGFGAPSTFGGVIPTPTLDRVANAG